MIRSGSLHRSHRRTSRGGRHSRTRGAALMMVLILVGVLFVVGMAAVTAATRDTLSGRNFAAYAVALQAAQSGTEVAARRLQHPWDVGLTHGENWPGTEGWQAMPISSDMGGSAMDAYYQVTVSTEGDVHTVTSVGAAVTGGGSPAVTDDFLATRTVSCTYQRPVIEIPYAVLAKGNVTIHRGVTIIGDVHANGNVMIDIGVSIQGNVTATGSVINWGTVMGTITEGAEEVFAPHIVYYGYRPRYDYNGMDCDAVQLSGGEIESPPPTGLPNNPNNLFYSELAELEIDGGDSDNEGMFSQLIASLLAGVSTPGGLEEDWLILPGTTIIAKQDLTIEGLVQVIASEGFPSLMVNDDLQLKEDAALVTEGLLQIKDDVKGYGGYVTGVIWRHYGPILIDAEGEIGANLSASVVRIEYRMGRTRYQPVGNIVLPVPMLSYTETP